MPSVAAQRAYLTTSLHRLAVGLEPSQAELLIARSLTQGHRVSLTREDTNPNAADASGTWWRAGMVAFFDRGFVSPRRIHATHVDWDWASSAAEMAARRFVRDDPNLPFTWFAKDHHVPLSPSLPELVQLLAWDLRYEGTRILDVDGTNPISLAVREERLYGVSCEWESPTAVFDWAVLDTSSRSLSGVQRPGEQLPASSPSIETWYGPPRLPDRARRFVLTALIPHARDLFSEPRLRVNLTNWTVSGYGQDPADWGDRLVAEAKDGLAYLRAPHFATEAHFLRWASRGGLDVAAPCALITGDTATTVLRVVPDTGLVTTQPMRDPAAKEALDAAHTICALTSKECACTQARTLLEATDEPDSSRNTNGQSFEPDWATRSRAIARVANGYALIRPPTPAWSA